MTCKSYRELVCWQLSVQLRNDLIEITDRPTVSRNFKFCEQVGDASRSAVSAIAEGFGRSNKEFHRYLQIALGSLQEAENHVDKALQRRFVSTAEHERLRGLAKRAHQAALGLAHYLEQRIRLLRAKSENPPRAGADALNLSNPSNPSNLSNLTNLTNPINS